jgi:ribonuclease VapC
MFLDTSAIIEYFVIGPSYDRISKALASTETRFCTSPTVMFEAVCVLSSRRQIAVSEALGLLDGFLSELNAEILPATRETGLAAIDAFARFGKGRHPAKLNFGDCFAYAGARSARMPLLYVGNDFAQTDLA